MSQQNGYIGRSPGDSAVIIASQTFEPTGIQTDFTFAAGYTVGHLDVYFNGARLIYANDYTATNGSTVGLTTYANNGDVLELVAYKAFNLGNITESPANFTVGNQLTVVGTTTATSAYYTGVVTATSFAGDGSALTGVASTDNIITSTASTFTGAVNITGAADGNLLNVSGITTVGILTVFDTTQSTSASTGGLVIHGGVGIAKSLFVDGNVTIGGTLTYEDMTNTDNLGFGTFRKGIEVQGAGSTTTTLNITGLSTAQGGIEFGASGVGGTVTALGHAEFVGIVTASGLDAAIAFWTLGASGTDHYTFTGPGDLSAENDPDLQLIRGQKYIFKNRSGGHPFRIQSTVNGSTGTAYNDGVTNNDGGNGTDIIFDVPFDAPAVLYYQCTSHGAMGGVIYIGSSSGDDVNVGVGATIHASSGNAVFAGIVTATTLKYGTTSVETAIDAKASTGKAIAMAMVFGF
jgi:hypothetical protein